MIDAGCADRRAACPWHRPKGVGQGAGARGGAQPFCCLLCGLGLGGALLGAGPATPHRGVAGQV
jgi:hypothetical protein